MLDKRYLRDNPDEARVRLTQRAAGYVDVLERLLAIDPERRSVQAELDALKQQRNSSSKEIGALMQAGNTAEAEERKTYVKTCLLYTSPSPRDRG
jgi:seryl-tRNA synthetase